MSQMIHAPVALSWLGRFCEAERERLFPWLVVLYGTGIGIYYALPQEPPRWSGVVSIIGCLMGMMLYMSRRRTSVLLQGLPLVLAPPWLGLIVAFGYTTALYYTDTEQTMLERAGTYTVIGRIKGVEPKKSGYRLTLERVFLGKEDALQGVSYDIRISVNSKKSPVPNPGSWVRGRARLAPPTPSLLPGGFDFQRYYWFRGIGANGFGYGAPAVIPQPVQLSEPSLTDGFIKSLSIKVAQYRLSVGQRLRAALDGDTGALVGAFVTAERLPLSRGLIEDMRHAGLAHLLAISGLHIALVSGIAFFTLRTLLAAIAPLALHWPIRSIAAVVAIGIGFGYTVMTGMTTPTVRAFIMAGIFMVGLIMGRRALSLRSMSFAALVLLAFNPSILVGASFQMSFASVTALVVLWEEINKKTRLLYRWGSLSFPHRSMVYLLGVLITTIIAGAATTPFALWHFHQMTGYGILSNLLAIPLMAFVIMPAALLSALLMPLGLEGIVLPVLGWGVDNLIAIAHEVASWPDSVYPVAAVPDSAILCLIAGGLWGLLWSGRIRYYGLVPMLFAVGMMVRAPLPDILLADNTRLMGIHDDGTLSLMVRGKKPRKFVLRSWLEYMGQPRLVPLAERPDFACSQNHCLLIKGEQIIALSFDKNTLFDDCTRANVVATSLSVRGRMACDAAVLIDKTDLRCAGAHALYLRDVGVPRVVTTLGENGLRPWVRLPYCPEGGKGTLSRYF